MSWTPEPVDEAPITVAWEITRACGLRCLHCRADAIPKRDPRELSTDEGKALIDEVKRIGARVIVITGGDPLIRNDVFALIDYAASQDLVVGFSPSATPRLTPSALRRARDAGTSTVHLSLDGAKEDIHDGFRGVRGSFWRTLHAMDEVRSQGLPLQVGTTVTRSTVQSLPSLARLIEGLAAMWSVFFLVPTGRGQADQMLPAEEHETVLRWLALVSESAPYRVRTTAAPTYRRVRRQLGLAAPPNLSANDGKGFCFVSHTGEIHPSGFLPIAAGDVRQDGLGAVYRESELFRKLRDPEQLRGKCSRCEFRSLCGGSRARAYAINGDPLAEDPSCPYQPAVAA